MADTILGAGDLGETQLKHISALICLSIVKCFRHWGKKDGSVLYLSVRQYQRVRDLKSSSLTMESPVLIPNQLHIDTFIKHKNELLEKRNFKTHKDIQEAQFFIIGFNRQCQNAKKN